MRRKELSPDKTSSIAVYVKKDLTPVRLTAFVNKAAVPPLCNAWRSAVNEYDLSERDLYYLECVLANYVNERLVLTNPITWDDLLDDLRAFSKASTVFLGELSRRSTEDSVWHRVQKETRPPGFAVATMKSMLSIFSEAVQAALSKAELQKKRGRSGITKSRGSDSSTNWLICSS
jgi:hypothetical protein